MKKYLSLFFCSLLFILGALPTFATVVSPYKVDFNSPVSTAEHSFKVASNWGHVVSSFSDDSYGSIGYYVDYQWSSDIGRDNTGGLEVGDQNHVGTTLYFGKTCDLLVTPEITGKSSIYVKQTSLDGAVKFYTVVQVGHSLKKDREITVTLPQLSCDGWTRVDIPSLSGERLGIYGSDVVFDDFEAESADLNYSRGLKIMSVQNRNPQYVDCNADGSFTFRCAVELQNTGDFDLNPGDDGYSLSVVDYRDASVPCFVVPVDRTIAAGKTSVVEVSGQIAQNGEISSTRYDIYENVTHSASPSGVWVAPVAYKPILRVACNGNDLTQGSVVSWHTVNSTVPKHFVIRNDGAAPLSVTSISVPEGFSLNSDVFPLFVAPHAEKNFSISLLDSNPGKYSGNVEVSADGTSGFSFAVNGTVVAKNCLLLDFEDAGLPSGSYAEDGWNIVQRDADTSDNVYMLCNASAGAESKFVTPLLSFAGGDRLSFDVARTDYADGGDNVFLNVYYSPDRRAWTLVRKISGSELPGESSGTYPCSYGKLSSFSIDNIPEGQFYVAFGAGNTCLDNVCGPLVAAVPHDVSFGDCVVPSEGKVNNVSSVKVTLVNRNSIAEQADGYSLALYVDGTIAAQTDGVELPPSSKTEFNLSFVPHVPGVHSICVSFKSLADEYCVSTAKTSYTVLPESSSVNLAVGEGAGVSRNTPICWYNADNSMGAYCDVVYGPDMLSRYGLEKGDSIVAISFEGTPNGDAAFSDLTLDARLSLADSATFVPGCDTEDMLAIPVYKGEPFTVTKDCKFITSLSLPSPLVWDGTSAVRVFTWINGGGTYCNVTYRYDSAYGIAYYRRGNETGFRSEKAPLALFSVERPSPTVSGVVSCSGSPVPDAALTLSSGDVVYSATSDEFGRYAFTVYQPNREYLMSVSADGYYPYSSADSLFIDCDLTYNIDLTKESTSIESLETSSPANEKLFNVYGQSVSKDWKGIVIKNGKKMLRP